MKPGLVLGRLAMILVGAVVSMGAVTAHAAIIWSEAGSGDLSNNGLSPTPLVTTFGSNRVLGTVGNSGQGIDRDYFRITVPAGATLTSILLNSASVSGGVSFIGIQPGDQLTVTPSGGGSELLVGLGHYGNDQVGTDLLPAIKIGAPGPLPSGTYSVWVQETGGPASYGLDFVINSTGGSTAVPTLPEWGMILLGMLLAVAYWRRQSGWRPVN